MKKITTETEYWFLKSAKHPLYLNTELFYIRIKTSGVEKISWIIGYQNDDTMVSINGELDPKLVEELEKEFQEELIKELEKEFQSSDINVRRFQDLKVNSKPEEYYNKKYGVS